MRYSADERSSTRHAVRLFLSGDDSYPYESVGVEESAWYHCALVRRYRVSGAWSRQRNKFQSIDPPTRPPCRLREVGGRLQQVGAIVALCASLHVYLA